MTLIKKKKKIGHLDTAYTSSFIDIMAPQGIQFNSKSIEFGDQFQRVLCIIDYPPKVNHAWLSRVSSLPGVVVSIHVQPKDPYELINQINISLGELGGKIEAGGNPVAVKRATDQYKDAERLLEQIDREQQQVFYVAVTLLITAKDKEELDRKTKQVEAKLAGQKMRARGVLFKQEEGLKTVGPFGICEKDISEIANRNMPCESLAASYPFVYSGLNDGRGNLLGTDKQGGIVLCDFWTRSESRTNSNMTILGRPGVGKSTVVKKILTFENANGTKIIIIDPEREYKDLCHNLEGDWLNVGGSGKGKINPLQVRNVPLDDEGEEEKLYEKDSNFGALSLHFQTLRTFFKLYKKSISDSQLSLLERALIEIYNEKNIFWNTDISILKNEDFPIMKDLYSKIKEKAEQDQELKTEWRKLELMLESAAIGADSAIFNGHTSIEAISDFIVLDIKNLLEADEEIRRAQFFNVLGWAWNETSKDRTEKCILATDETYLLVDPETPQALQFLRNTSKRIRKYEGGLMVITHNLVDFLDPAVRRYGQALIDNPVYKMIMGQGDKDIEALEKLMTLSEKEKMTLMEGKRGEALFVAGNRRLHLKIDISPFEEEMFGKAGGR